MRNGIVYKKLIEVRFKNELIILYKLWSCYDLFSYICCFYFSVSV